MAVISEYQMIMCLSFTQQTLEVICKGLYLECHLLVPSFTKTFEFHHLIFICHRFMEQEAFFNGKDFHTLDLNCIISVCINVIPH